MISKALHYNLFIVFVLLICEMHAQALPLKNKYDLLNVMNNNDQNVWDLKASFYIDSLDNEEFNQIKNKKTFSYLSLPNSHTLWCKIVVFNNTLKSKKLHLSIFPLVFQDIFIETEAMDFSKKHDIYKDKFERPVSFLPNETKIIWFKTANVNFSLNFEPKLFSHETYINIVSNRKAIDVKMLGFLFMLIGFLIFTSIFSTIQGVYFQNPTYFFWSMYLIATSIAFISELDRSFDLGFLHLTKSQNILTKYFIEGQFLIHITYLLFISSYLELKKASKRIYTIIKIANFYNITCFIVFLVFHKIPYISDALDITVLLANLLILAVVVNLYFSKIKHRKLILIGSMFLLVFGTFSVFINIPRILNKNIFWLMPFVIYSYGVLLELLFFSVALSKRTHLIQLENIELQKNYTENLESELLNRIETNRHQNRLLEEQRIKSITSEFEQKIVQTEIKALRAQMNPHFIFNCLNSIEFFTANNQTEKASEYLTKFSRLIRLVLENSRSEKVTLEDELETLRLYIEMEAMRFRGKVKYQINVDKDIDTSDIQIPPLLIQPFVENAIWHGLMHKEEGGEIIIEVKLANENLLHIEIIDNGVGREKAMEYKSKSATKNKSFGMKVTAERIDLINKMYKTDTKIEILDLKNNVDEASGTKVIVEIPF